MMKCLIRNMTPLIFIIVPVSLVSTKIPTVSQNLTKLDVCFNNIFNQNEIINVCVVNFQEKIIIQKPKVDILLNDVPDFKFKTNTFDLFLINMSYDISNIMSQLKNGHFNPSLKFIVLSSTKENIEILLQKLYNFYIINVVIINETTFDMFTYNPLRYEDVHPSEFTSINLGSCLSRILNPLFPNKIPKLWRNTTLIVTCLNIPPFVFRRSEKKRLKGFEVMTMKDVSKSLKFKSRLETNFQFWGYKYGENNFSDVYKEIYDKKSDTGMGFFGSLELYDEFDYTTFVGLTKNVWVLPVAPKVSNWRKFILIFTKKGWMCQAFFLLMTSLSISWMSKLIGNNHSILEGMLSFLMTFVCNNYKNLQKSQIRLVIFIANIYALLLSATITGFLIIFLTKTIYEHQIQSVDEIIQNNFHIAINPQAVRIFDGWDKFVTDYFLKNLHFCFRDDCFDYVISTRKFVTIKFEADMKFIMKTKLYDNNSDPMVFLSSKNGHVLTSRWPFAKGHPMVQAVSSKIGQLRSGGIFKYYRLQMERRAEREAHKLLQEKLKFIAISIHHLRPALEIWITCLGLSFGVFLLELATKYKFYAPK